MDAADWMTPPAPSEVETPGGVDDPGGAYLGGALAVEEVGTVDAIEREAVGGVALAVGPDGQVAEAVVGAGAGGELCIDAGREDRRLSKRPVGKRDLLDLRLIEHVAVGGVDLR